MSALSTSLPNAIVSEIKTLEPLPATAQRLVDMVASGAEVSGAELADLIELDAAMTATLLRHGSSMRYAVGGTASIRESVLRMGVVAVLDLVMEGYLDRLRASTPLYDLTEEDLWLHGAASRLAAATIRQECRGANIPAIAETAALLHDIGKLLVSRYLKRDVRDLLNYARMRRCTFVEAERALVGTDHAAVGGAIARQWRFPAEVTEAITHHHSPATIDPTPVLDTVVVANVVAKTIEAGLGAEGLNFSVDPASYSRLGLDFASFGRVCLTTEATLRAVLKDRRRAPSRA